MGQTPAGVTITATAPDGSTRDVTEAVQVLYDLVIQSMDWGSGFLTIEDVEPMVALAEFCGFKGSEAPREYIGAARRAAEVLAAREAEREAALIADGQLVDADGTRYAGRVTPSGWMFPVRAGARIVGVEFQGCIWPVLEEIFPSSGTYMIDPASLVTVVDA